MIRSITVTNYLGEKLTVNMTEAEPKSGLLIQKITGLGPIKADINMTDLATTDGSKYNSSRFQTRNIVITFKLVESSPEVTDVYASADTFNIENSRQRTYKYFPGKKPLTLSIKTDNRDARITGYVESNEPDIFSKEETEVISIICPDPYFYSNVEGYSPHVVEFSGLDDLFEFPYSNESLTENLTEFGDITPVTIKSFAYFGDQETGIHMIIHFVDEVATNIRIDKRLPSDTSVVMGFFLLEVEKMQALFGTNFLTGDTIEINTIAGQEQIMLLRNGVYHNILNVASRDSNWFQLNKGTNVFYMTAYGNETALTFRIENYVIYEGV